MAVAIAPLQATDRARLEELARGYKAFYKTDTPATEYERAWQRLSAQDGVFGLGAKQGGQLVGLAHYLFHASTWAQSVCYPQDLYTVPSARGAGVARALIEATAERARQHGAQRFYWLTQENNVVARRLYEKVARYNGFIRYDFVFGAGA